MNTLAPHERCSLARLTGLCQLQARGLASLDPHKEA